MSESKDLLLKVMIIIKLNLDITEIKINEGPLIDIDQKICSDDSDIDESIKAT